MLLVEPGAIDCGVEFDVLLVKPGGGRIGWLPGGSDKGVLSSAVLPVSSGGTSKGILSSAVSPVSPGGTRGGILSSAVLPVLGVRGMPESIGVIGCVPSIALILFVR